MNGIHDVGGMQGFGPIIHEANEPTFHANWEGRVYAMVRVLRSRGGAWNIDSFRDGLERLPPGDYLRSTYYERWFAWLLRKVVETGDLTRAEIDSGTPSEGVPRRSPIVAEDEVVAMAATRNSARRNVRVVARFKAGQSVRARNIHPEGHTRLPRYVRGKVGQVVLDRGVFVFPDANAQLKGEEPQHLYSVRFAARELWGESASARDSVHLDLWDEYLAPA
jgi:nitrile hydratase